MDSTGMTEELNRKYQVLKDYLKFFGSLLLPIQAESIRRSFWIRRRSAWERKM